MFRFAKRINIYTNSLQRLIDLKQRIKRTREAISTLNKKINEIQSSLDVEKRKLFKKFSLIKHYKNELANLQDEISKKSTLLKYNEETFNKDFNQYLLKVKMHIIEEAAFKYNKYIGYDFDIYEKAFLGTFYADGKIGANGTGGFSTIVEYYFYPRYGYHDVYKDFANLDFNLDSSLLDEAIQKIGIAIDKCFSDLDCLEKYYEHVTNSFVPLLIFELSKNDNKKELLTFEDYCAYFIPTTYSSIESIYKKMKIDTNYEAFYNEGKKCLNRIMENKSKLLKNQYGQVIFRFRYLSYYNDWKKIRKRINVDKNLFTLDKMPFSQAEKLSNDYYSFFKNKDYLGALRFILTWCLNNVFHPIYLEYLFVAAVSCGFLEMAYQIILDEVRVLSDFGINFEFTSHLQKFEDLTTFYLSVKGIRDADCLAETYNDFIKHIIYRWCAIKDDTYNVINICKDKKQLFEIVDRMRMIDENNLYNKGWVV